MTLDRSYIGYLGFLGIDLFKSVLMYSNGAFCLIKLLFDLGLFTVCGLWEEPTYDVEKAWPSINDSYSLVQNIHMVDNAKL
jgi:hypothetical protein